MRRPTAVFLASLAAAPGPVAGTEGEAGAGVATFLREQRVSGVLRSDYFRSSKTLDDNTDFFGVTAQLKALPTLAEHLDGKLELRVTNPALGEGAVTQGRLLEGYVTAHFAKADLRLGKQIVAWGRADGINPTDNLTPRDYVVLLPFEDDQRFGTLAVKLDTYLSATHTVSLFLTPFFEPARIPLPPPPAQVQKQTPAATLANTQIGVKLDKVGAGLDWSVSYFHGFSPLPDLRVLGGTPAAPVLARRYDRINVYGADIARNVGRVGIRAEAAYIDTADKSGADPGAKNPSLFWVLGVDRTFFENLNVNLQFFQRRVRRYHDPQDIADPLERSTAIQNAILDGQRDRLNNGLSLRIGHKWFNDTLTAELLAIVNTTRRDRSWRPLLTYAFSDHWKGTLGAEFYNGDPDTRFGSLKRNQGGFVEGWYGF